jgi:hypothetical protein
MGGACSTHRGEEKCIKSLCETVQQTLLEKFRNETSLAICGVSVDTRTLLYMDSNARR